MNRNVTIASVLTVLAGSPHVFAQNAAPNAGAAAPVIAPSQERARHPSKLERCCADADAELSRIQPPPRSHQILGKSLRKRNG